MLSLVENPAGVCHYSLPLRPYLGKHISHMRASVSRMKGKVGSTWESTGASLKANETPFKLLSSRKVFLSVAADIGLVLLDKPWSNVLLYKAKPRISSAASGGWGRASLRQHLLIHGADTLPVAQEVLRLELQASSCNDLKPPLQGPQGLLMGNTRKHLVHPALQSPKLRTLTCNSLRPVQRAVLGLASWERAT
jgi:hypothetical protein